MSLLDDLQKEVRDIRAREIQQSAELRAQQSFYQEFLRPAMVRAHDYFAEVVENLNIVAPEVKAIYPLNPLLENGVVLRQSQYTFRSDNKESPHEIDIFCKCTLEKPHEFYLNGQKSVVAHADLLDSYNFPYHRKNKLDRHYEIRGATFILEGPMIVQIRIAANPADECVHITFRNVERQAVKRYKFAPERLNMEFLDRLAMVLIRRVPQLLEQKVDDRFRVQLRNKINRDKRLNDAGLARAYAESEATKAADKNNTLVDRTRSAVVGQLRRVFSRR